MKSPLFVLASQSPRRKELLKSAGASRFRVLSPISPEKFSKKESLKKNLNRISMEKAASLVERFPSLNPTIILAADTIVVDLKKSQVLGKPQNPRQAVQMLQKLMGQAHDVYTGYTLLKVQSGEIVRSCSKVVRTRVYFRSATLKEVKEYVKTGEPLDKAGAYGIQEKGLRFVKKIVGSYSNVVGLPLVEVLQDLKSEFDFEF